MPEDEKLAVDELQRTSQHEAVKGKVRNEVHNEIARRADRLNSTELSKADSLAGKFKQKAITEVADTEAEIERAKTVARISQIIDYIFGLVYGIIGLEIVLDLLGARDSSEFKRFLDKISAPLLAPFRGLMPNPSFDHFHLMLSYVMALVIYALLHLAINGLLRLFAHKKTRI